MEVYAVVWLIIPIFTIIVFPTLSWAIGKWYQNRLMSALLENEKQEGKMLQSDKHLSTSSSMTSMTAESSTLLHVSICVGPSWGQIFFMWFKSMTKIENGQSAIPDA